MRSDFVTNEAWNRYHEYWAITYFRARSEKVSQNRKREKGSLGIGPSKHTGDTRYFHTFEDALDRDEDDEVTPNDVFLHVHTKYHDGVTFISRAHEEAGGAHSGYTGLANDEKQLYYDAAGKCSKGACFRVEPVGNAHGLQSKHISGTTTANTSGASSAGRDRSRSFTTATDDDDDEDIND
ncbi:hypothetical protein Syun_001545 [Stephania yunnanensis]|uniref:Uncharacterized protein n=1 Tax=Stephania yunnanensis TaxID=152371 RepID=A0AAP0Q6K2_9MAGN